MPRRDGAARPRGCPAPSGPREAASGPPDPPGKPSCLLGGSGGTEGTASPPKGVVSPVPCRQGLGSSGRSRVTWRNLINLALCCQPHRAVARRCKPWQDPALLEVLYRTDTAKVLPACERSGCVSCGNQGFPVSSALTTKLHIHGCKYHRNTLFKQSKPVEQKV